MFSRAATPRTGRAFLLLHDPTAPGACRRTLAAVLGAIVAAAVLPYAACLAADEALIMGVFPRRSPGTTTELFSPLARHLAKQLGREVRLETTPDFASFWENVAAQRYDIVHFNQYHYVRSHAEYGYRVILKNEEFGHSNISGALIARKDSSIETVADLRGKKVVFGGGRTAMQGYIVATYLLRQAGLKDGDYFTQFALNPPKACIATYFRQGAAAGAGGAVLQLPKVRKEIDVEQMRYLAVSEPLAHLPWAVRADMDEDTAARIRRAGEHLAGHPEGRKVLETARLSALVAASDAEYDRHRHIIRVVLGEDY